MNVNPCRKDCPNRSPTCHGECDAYAEYFELRRAERKAEHDDAGVEFVRKGSYYQYIKKAEKAKCRMFIHR